MHPLVPTALWLLANVVMGVLRAPHIRLSRTVAVVRSCYGPGDVALVVLVGVGLVVLPLVWALSPLLGFADRPLRPFPLGAGAAVYALGLWLLHRSHVDLGRNWSNTLQVREGHTLVTGGVYTRLRHPMYLALLLHGVGQALVLPNAVAGPGFLLAFALLVLSRLGPEERMLREQFGAAYEAYAARAWRLLPGVW